MRRNMYGTVAALAWVINHYFFNETHYVYLATEFYPYKLRNPRSSSPFMIYQDLYEPWRDQDDNSKIVNMYRLALWGGVEAKKNQGVIDEKLAKRLMHICNKLNVMFFYPLVYRVDTDELDDSRLQVAGSGLKGSSEYLVQDLEDDEIDEILFLDFDADDDFKRVVLEEYLASCDGLDLNDPNDVLVTLERRCDSSGLRLPFSTS